MRRLSPLLVFGLILAISAVSTTSAASRQSLTRAEAVALMVDSQPDLKNRLQWFIKHMPPMPLYLDANPKAWYGPYLETAFEAGIIIGSPDRSFRPKADITIEEAAVMMTRLRKRGGANAVVLYPPNSTSSWGDRALAEAISSGISVPNRFQIGQPIHPEDFYVMMRSAGVRNPELIALSINPAEGYLPKVTSLIAQAPARTVSVARPQATTATRIQPIRTTQTASVTAQGRTTTSRGFSISMPSLGIKNLVITHPSDPFTSKGLLAPLQAGVGHLFTYPGHAGKILIYGHSSSYPWDVSPFTKIFRQMNKLNVGDKVYITYDGKEYAYQVSSKQAVPAADMSAYQGSGEEELILYTCWPPDSISQRYLVHAKPV